MLTLDIVHFIKTEFPIDAIDMFLNSRIKKIVSATLCCKVLGPTSELSLFVLCFPFAHMDNFQLVLNIL